jgi:hypothetical protein
MAQTSSPASFPLLTEGKRRKTCDAVPPARIDTLAFSFPIFDRDSTGATTSIAHEGTEDEVRSSRQKLRNGGFVAFANVHDSAWVEASLPKRLDGQNIEALTVRDALEVARSAMEEATEFVTPTKMGERFELSKLIRLDGVRDFDDVSSISEILNGLAAVPREARLKVRRFQDAQRNNTESLRVGPKSWNAQMYDKHAETGGEAEVGRLRFEVRMRSDQLTDQRAKKEGYLMRQLVDVTEERVGLLTRRSFERVSFDREVVGKASVARKVFGSSLMSPREQSQLWAYLTAPGVAESMAPNTRSKYRRLAAELGVTMAAADTEMADIYARLDFDAGREVVRVA